MTYNIRLVPNSRHVMIHKNIIIYFLLINITTFCISSAIDKNVNIFDFLEKQKYNLKKIEAQIEELQISYQKTPSLPNKWYLADAVRNKKYIEENNWEKVVHLIKTGVPGNDYNGKGQTLLDLAPSEKIYHELRSAGVNFQIMPYIKFYPITSSIATLTTATVCYYLYRNEYFSSQRFTNYFKNLQARAHNTTQNIKTSIFGIKRINNTYECNKMDSIDKFGRTPLMNYIIDQEKKLYQLRANIINRSELNQDTYFFNTCSDLIVEHQELKNTTLTHIKMMIEQEAPLDTLDYQGKSLLNYCHTDEIYQELRKAGAPLDLIPGAYFTGRPLCKLGFIGAGMILVFTGFIIAVCKGDLGNHYIIYY